MNKWKCLTRAHVYDQSCRRIFRGDVPFITDSDGDHHPRGKSDLDEESPKMESESQSKPASGKSSAPKRSKHKGPKAPEKFPSNYIKTSRYNIWNFLPKFLFEQFQRVANFYFLTIAVIQASKRTAVNPVLAIAPLVFVIFVSGVKQGYEDWLRHKNDDVVNNRNVKVVKNGEIVETKSKYVVVGDIIRLNSDDPVPTDVLILASSDEYSRCQINTANLDGETNLKLRYCPSGMPHFKSPDDFNSLHAILECEHPNANLYDFSGSLMIPFSKLHEMKWNRTSVVVEEASETGVTGPMENVLSKKSDHIEDLTKTGLVHYGDTDFLSIPLSMDNMVLRGTRLKNTDYIYGIVVYTGKDTRLGRNLQKSDAKMSTLESRILWYLLFFMALLIILVLLACLMYYLVDWYGIRGKNPWYIGFPENIDSETAWGAIASTIALYNYIIPISLYVTVEMQKFLGSKFFVWDIDLRDDQGKPPLCNTSDLNEELGQIEYLFSDKTGTLTKNLMQFRCCSINAIKFEYAEEKLYKVEQVEHITKEHISRRGAPQDTPGRTSPDRNSPERERSHISSIDVDRINLEVTKTQVDVSNLPSALHFFIVLALCHSVQVVAKRRPTETDDFPSFGFKSKKKKRKEAGKVLSSKGNSAESLTSPPSNEKEYQASSPDEKALLESCAKLGITFTGEQENILTLNVLGQIKKFKRLMQLEFDADRKCMSVIVKNDKGEIWLYTKGAESSIVPKCDAGPSNQTLEHVMDFALLGLRTLAVSERKLTQSEFEEFNHELRAARRVFKDTQEKVREVYSKLEDHMTLLGATAVEDQLQDNVPETLQAFAAAGIRVWMLTGDKLETGINVAISCGLITATTIRYVVSKTSISYEIRSALNQFKSDIDPNGNTCFVIDGESLAVAFRECPKLLQEVSMKVTRVVCCRMAPLQKAQVVQMVKNSGKKPTCCAVGDGANDCAMILAAHIGIGIMGKEGPQAARCADFAIAKFGLLKKAVLVHGHWYYVRLANLANYFFYKNMVLVVPQFFFSFHSKFALLNIFNGIFLSCYNIFFTSLPVFVYSLTEQTYSSETLLNNPQLYRAIARNDLMSVRTFIKWLLFSIWHPCACYYLSYLGWKYFDKVHSVEALGTCVYAAVLLVASGKLFVETIFISWMTVTSFLVSFLAFFAIAALFGEGLLFEFLVNEGEKDGYFNVFFKLLGGFSFWLLIVLVVSVALLPDVTLAIAKGLCVPLVKRHLVTPGKVDSKG